MNRAVEMILYELTERTSYFDIAAILDALGEATSQWDWFINVGLEAFGTPITEALCRQGEKLVYPAGIWLLPEEMLTWANATCQTLEGCFVAYPHGFANRELTKRDRSQRAFPDNQMQCIIDAIRGDEIVVSLKDDMLIRRITTHFSHIHILAKNLEQHDL